MDYFAWFDNNRLHNRLSESIAAYTQNCVLNTFQLITHVAFVWAEKESKRKKRWNKCERKINLANGYFGRETFFRCTHSECVYLGQTDVHQYQSFFEFFYIWSVFVFTKVTAFNSCTSEKQFTCLLKICSIAIYFQKE